LGRLWTDEISQEKLSELAKKCCLNFCAWCDMLDRTSWENRWKSTKRCRKSKNNKSSKKATPMLSPTKISHCVNKHVLMAFIADVLLILIATCWLRRKSMLRIVSCDISFTFIILVINVYSHIDVRVLQ
jgi:hypothetical protein